MSPDPPRRAVEDRLREEMLAAQQRYFTANEEYVRLRQLSLAGPDSVYARDQAEHARKAAFDEYARALRRYNDMVALNVLPEDVRRAG